MKRTVFCALLWCFTAVALLVRLWQVGYVMDDFGFYNAPQESLCFWVNLVLWGGIVLLGFCSRFLLRDCPARPPKKSIALGLGSLCVSFFCLPQVYMDCVTAQNSDAMMLAMIPSVVTALSFAVLAAYQIRGRKIPFGALIVPIVSELMRVIVAYTHFSGLSRMSENAVHILFLVSFLSLCMSHLWMHFSGNRSKGIFGCYTFGAATALFGLMDTLPHWMMGNNQLPLSYVGFGAAIYALTLMGVHAFGNGQERNQQEVPAQEPATPLSLEEEADESVAPNEE